MKNIIYDIDNLHGSMSGTTTALYLIPSEESYSGDIEICLWHCVGPGQPMYAYHGRWLYLGSPGTECVPEALIERLSHYEDKFRELDEAYQGTEWDGHNHIGKWDNIAEDVSQLLDLEGVAMFWDAADWLGADWSAVDSDLETCQSIEQLAQDYANEAQGDGEAVLDTDYLENVLRHRRDSLIEELESTVAELLEWDDDVDAEELDNLNARIEILKLI